MAPFGARSRCCTANDTPDSPKGATMPKRLTVAVIAATILAGAGTAVAQTVQRFDDVPPDHEAFEAVEWAADAGLTVGYGDGTFRPDEPLPKWRALVFMGSYYDNVLGAGESEDFTSGDMMVLLKTIDDGTSLQPQPVAPEPDPEPEARWLPRGDGGRIASGRCAPAIVMGIYDWEECAWGVSDDPEMSRSEMTAMVTKVWSETKASGKPTDPPNLTEGYCGDGVLGCYLASSHTIQLAQGFTLQVLLHELAHALTSGDDEHRACADDWTHRRPECWHGDLYRCAADALYVRYAGIDAAGVCGTPPDLEPGDWYLGEPFETEWGVIHALAAVLDTNSDYHLFARCASRFDTEGRWLSLGMGLPQDADGDELRIVTRLTGDSEPNDHAWRVSGETADVVWWPGEVTLPAERWRGTLHVAVYYDDRDVGRTQFELGDSPALAIVRSACN